MTRRLAVVAHFNALGQVAPHVHRQLEMLSHSFDRVILASTSAITGTDRESVLRNAEIIDRANVGQDFGSWHEALDREGLAQDFDELLLTNDSYVSVIPDLAPVLDRMRERPVEVWGLTMSWRHQQHIQSYFVHFDRPALHSHAFHKFWSDFQPARDRTSAIMNQELGLSRAMREAGFRLGSYFEPTRSERLLGNRRGVQWLVQRRRAYPAHYLSFRDSFRWRNFRDPAEANNLNWATDFADFVFDRARYPVVKFDTLRYDPHWLGAGTLLADCEEEFPESFQGVREYIEATRSAYPGRAFENHRPAQLGALRQRLYGYRKQGDDQRRRFR